MRTETKTIDIYKFNELSETAKERAINDQINFLMETADIKDNYVSGNFKKAVDKAEKMQTPWFTGSYIWDYCKDEIESDLNECEFTEDGKLY